MCNIEYQNKLIDAEAFGEWIAQRPCKQTVKPVVTFVVDELDMMAADLSDLRCTDADYELPFARLTPEQMDEIEAERIGEDFSLRPFEY